MSTVNEYLMQKGLDQYIWAFATQGFEGEECLREIMALDAIGLDRLATQTLRNAERALGVVSTEQDEDEIQYVTSALPGLYIEIPTHRLGRAKGKTFTEYSVNVHTVDGSLATQIYHRYSGFEELRKQMEKTMVSKADAAALPKLPKKKAVGSQSDAVVLERQQQLRIFLERMLVHLRSGPKAARELLDKFLGLPVPLKVPEAARSSGTTAALAVAVKLPPKLQALADRLQLERAEIDEILESVDHDVDQAMECIRDEYREQLCEEEQASEEEEDQSDDDEFDHDAGQYHDSIDDLDGGWGDRFDPRSTLVMDQVTTIDETDRAKVEFHRPLLHSKFEIIQNYFAADAEYRSETQLSDDGGAETEERFDVQAGLQAIQLEQYVDVLIEYEFDDPSLWREFDDSAWGEMFEMMEIDPSHWKVLQAVFTNPTAFALVSGAEPPSSGATDRVDASVDTRKSPEEEDCAISTHSSKSSGSPAALRTQHSVDRSPRRVATQDSSPSPQVRTYPPYPGTNAHLDQRPYLLMLSIMGMLLRGIQARSHALQHGRHTPRFNTRSFTMPEVAPRPPLQPEPDRALGDGFFPGAALPRPRRTSAHIALDGGGASSGPLFSVVYTGAGVTHAWSEAGAGEMRAACSNPKLMCAHGKRSDPRLDAARHMWAPECLHHRTSRRSRHGTPYKLINDAHSQTIGPNVNVCLSTLIESYQQEAETLQVVNGIIAAEATRSAKRCDSYRRGAVVSTPAQVPRAANGWISGPLCTVSKLPLATGSASDGSTVVLAQRGSKCVRGAHIELLSSKIQHGEEGRPDAGAGTVPTCRGDIARAFKQDLQKMKEAEENGQIELLEEADALGEEIERMMQEFLAASAEEQGEMAKDLRVTRDTLLMDQARARKEAVLWKAKAQEQLIQRTRVMRAQMDACTTARQQVVAATAPVVGPVMEAARAAGEPARDPRQQMVAWKEARKDARRLLQQQSTAGHDQAGGCTVSRGALDDVNMVFAKLADGDYTNVKHDLKDFKIPTRLTADSDTDGWGEQVVEKADWSALLQIEA